MERLPRMDSLMRRHRRINGHAADGVLNFAGVGRVGMMMCVVLKLVHDNRLTNDTFERVGWNGLPTGGDGGIYPARV